MFNNAIVPIFLSGFAVALVSFIGLLLMRTSTRIKDILETKLNLLKSVSAGIFFVTSIFLVMKASATLEGAELLVSLAIGAILYIAIHALVCGHHHETTKKRDASLKVLIGDAIHNIADGFILVASFATGTVFGIGSLFSIIIHEIPQEISKFLVLKSSGYSDTQASLRSFFSALSIFIGIAIGLFISSSPALRAYFLGASASFFLGVVFHDLFPLHEMKTMRREKAFFRHLKAFLVGVIVMILVAMVIHHVQG